MLGRSDSGRVQLLERELGDLHCLNEEYNGPDVSQGIRRTIRLRSRPHVLVSDRWLDPQHHHRRHDQDGSGHFPTGPLRSLCAQFLARDWGVFARMRNSGVAIRVGSTTDHTFAVGVSVTASPFQAGATMAVAANDRPINENRIGQPEPDQAKPSEEGMETTSRHSESALRGFCRAGGSREVYRPGWSPSGSTLSALVKADFSDVAPCRRVRIDPLPN